MPKDPVLRRRSDKDHTHGMLANPSERCWMPASEGGEAKLSASSHDKCLSCGRRTPLLSGDNCWPKSIKIVQMSQTCLRLSGCTCVLPH